MSTSYYTEAREVLLANLETLLGVLRDHDEPWHTRTALFHMEQYATELRKIAEGEQIRQANGHLSFSQAAIPSPSGSAVYIDRITRKS